MARDGAIVKRRVAGKRGKRAAGLVYNEIGRGQVPIMTVAACKGDIQFSGADLRDP